MKNLKWIVLVTLIMIILNSCDMSIIQDFWYIDTTKINEIFTNSKQIDKYKNNYITYKSDSYENIQTPYEVQSSRLGDCEDQCVFALALNYRYLNKKGKLYLVDTKGEGFITHCMYSINGRMYNRAKGSYKIIYTYNFNEIPHISSFVR